ncbi:MAG TPA: cupin domain-containing protein [Conexibacter sp.]|jgi:transcriptional regulator with XRE-family HTH domain/mannose-6-phosphate isomerase-like protein (cupin superfamily)
MTDNANTFGNRLRHERERQRIGVRELSRRLEVSASMISQIERGRVMPSVNTLYSITSALGISLDELFRAADGTGVDEGEGAAGSGASSGPASTDGDGAAGSSEARPAASGGGATATLSEAGPVVRHAEAQSLELSSGVRWELLTSQPDSSVDFLRTIYQPGSESAPADALMRHNGHEYGTVIDGRLNVTVGFETFELEPGDSISFDSAVPHRLFNVGDVTATAIWVVVGRRADGRQGEQ